MGNTNMWVDGLWLTHKESVTIKDPVSGDSVTREISVGMTVKSDRTARSDAMYTALRTSLNVIVEEEKETWLESHLMKEEVMKLSADLEDAPDDTKEVIDGQPEQTKEG